MLTDPQSRKGQPQHYIWSPLKTENESNAPSNLTLTRKKGKNIILSRYKHRHMKITPAVSGYTAPAKSKNPSLIADLHHFL